MRIKSIIGLGAGLGLGLVLLIAESAAAHEVEVGTVRTRQHEVRIVTGNPPRYTVTDRGGRVLLERATLPEVARRYPDVHRALTRGIAGTEDATLRR